MLSEYHSWKEMFRRQEMHVGVMTDSPFLKAYVSTTRDMKIAKSGAKGQLATDVVMDADLVNGWVYALRVEPGFYIRPGVAGVTKEEAEIAHLGPILWKNVYGFRSFGHDPRVYIRFGFDTSDNVAFRLVLASLSIGLNG
jgi:hypothetical protein